MENPDWEPGLFCSRPFVLSASCIERPSYGARIFQMWAGHTSISDNDTTWMWMEINELLDANELLDDLEAQEPTSQPVTLGHVVKQALPQAHSSSSDDRSEITAMPPERDLPSEAKAPQQRQCIGADLKLPQSAPCTPGFVAGQPHLTDKVCEVCRTGFAVSAAQVRVLSSAHERMFSNSFRGGFWSVLSDQSPYQYRVINNASKCKGPSFVLFRGAVPIRSDWEPIPDQWVHDGDVVWLHVAYGTLVPLLNHQRERAHVNVSTQDFICHPVGLGDGATSSVACSSLGGAALPGGRRDGQASGLRPCLRCKRMHVSCDRGEPCQRCVQGGLECVPAQAKRLGRPPKKRPFEAMQQAVPLHQAATTQQLQGEAAHLTAAQPTAVVIPPSPPTSPPEHLLALPPKVRMHPITLRLDDEDMERELSYRSFDTCYYVLSLFLILDIMCRVLFPMNEAAWFDTSSDMSTTVAYTCNVATHVTVLVGVRRVHSMPKHKAAAFKTCVWTTTWAVNIMVWWAMLLTGMARRLTAAEGQAAAVSCAMWGSVMVLQHVLHIEFRCRLLVMLMATSLALTSVEWRKEMLAASMFGEAVGYSMEHMTRSRYLLHAKSVEEMRSVETDYDLQTLRCHRYTI